MIIYWRKNGVQKPDFLDYRCTQYDIKGAGRMWHLDLPNFPTPITPTDSTKLLKIEDELYMFEFGPTPKPEQLLKRKVPYPGSKVKLADDNFWHVPMARNALDGTLLPTRYKLIIGGSMEQIKPEFIKAYEAGLTIWNWLEDKEKPPTILDVYDVYATVLKVNYNITKYDAYYYGLYCEETRFDFYAAVTDFATMQKYLGGNEAKKSDGQ